MVPATVDAIYTDRLTCLTPSVLGGGVSSTGSTTSSAACLAYESLLPDSVPVRLTLNGNNSAAADLNAMTSGEAAPKFAYVETASCGAELEY